MPTSNRLRHDIDRGYAGDKVAYPDPAAAPLGTDDEAGGCPPTAEEIALARRHEVRDRPSAGPLGADEVERATPEAERAMVRRMRLRIAIPVAVAIVALLIVTWGLQP